MKFGIRKPSLKKSIAARMSVKKKIAPRMPRGMGILRDPEKAVYNKVYNMTTISAAEIIKKTRHNMEDKNTGNETPGSAAIGFVILGVIIILIVILVKFVF